MEAEFWHHRWESGEIAFHEQQVNRALVGHFAKLNLPKGARWFVPLCGKTRDIGWLLEQGYRVAGVELSSVAVGELFRELGVEPHIVTVGKLTCYSASGIDIWVGDVFHLCREALGAVDAIYDRAAMVALPEEMRRRYANHLARLSQGAPQLLVCYEYDQCLYEGPPFSVCEAEIRQSYGEIYHLTLVAQEQTAGEGKRNFESKNTVWLLETTSNSISFCDP